MYFSESRVFGVFSSYKVLKKNIWIKNYIGEEILDGWDQTVRKLELKRRSYAIFVIVLSLGKMDFEHLLVFWL